MLWVSKLNDLQITGMVSFIVGPIVPPTNLERVPTCHGCLDDTPSAPEAAVLWPLQLQPHRRVGAAVAGRSVVRGCVMERQPQHDRGLQMQGNAAAIGWQVERSSDTNLFRTDLGNVSAISLVSQSFLHRGCYCQEEHSCCSMHKGFRSGSPSFSPLPPPARRPALLVRAGRGTADPAARSTDPFRRLAPQLTAVARPLPDGARRTALPPTPPLRR